MKILLAFTYSKDELYIAEYINHYKKLGIDKFICGDWTPERYPFKIQNIIHNIEVWDRHTEDFSKTVFFNDVYQKYGNEYDWICMFSSEEYLMIPKYSSLQEMLSDEIYNNFNVISVNFKTYSDTGYIKYSPGSIIEKYTQLYGTLNSKCNRTTKSIVRGKQNIICNSKHGPRQKENTIKINICDVLGNIKDDSPTIIKTHMPYDYYNTCYLARYTYKSIEEFIRKRIYYENLNREEIIHQLEVFFNHCVYTVQKDNIAIDMLNKIR